MVLAGTLWGRDAAYGHPTAGYLEELEKLGVADARAFWQQRWAPDRMTLVVAGDVDRAWLEEQLGAGLGAWTNDKATKAAAPSVAAKKVTSRLVLVDRPGAEQSDVRVGLTGILRTDKRWHAAEVLATTLGGTFTSRLNRRLREELGWTYGIRASFRALRRSGSFTIGSSIFTPKTGPAIGEILKIVGAMAAKNIPAAELTRIKMNLVRELPQGFKSVEGVAGAFALLVEHGLPDSWYEGYAAAIGKVTAKEVRGLAKTLIPAGKMVVVIVGDVAAIKNDLAKLKLGKHLTVENK
jgi:predicted Zn-dependent peptidase